MNQFLNINNLETEQGKTFTYKADALSVTRS